MHSAALGLPPVRGCVWLQTPEQSVELSLEDVRSAAQAMGFRLVREESLDVPYMGEW